METLDIGHDFGAVTTIAFSTDITALSNGMEQRNVKQVQPLIRINLGDRQLRRRQRETLEDLHHATEGSTDPFLIRDWTDYQAHHAYLGDGDGITRSFRLVKWYEFGGVKMRRPIRYVENLRVSGNTSYRLGDARIIFDKAPDPGVPIFASFDFMVPVRFEQDQLPLRFDYGQCDEDLFNFSGIAVREVREEYDVPIDPVTPDIDQEIDLGYDYGTVGGDRYSTSIATVSSGFERRDQDWSMPLGRWNIAQRELLDAEKDHLVNLFRCVRGSACTFRYYSFARDDYARVRFESDQLSIRYDATRDDCQNLFNFEGIPLVETRMLVA